MAQQEFDIMKPISSDLDIGTTMFDNPIDVSREQADAPVSDADIWNMAPPPFPGGEPQKPAPVATTDVTDIQAVKAVSETNSTAVRPVQPSRTMDHLDMGYMTEAEAQLFSVINNDSSFAAPLSSSNTVSPVISQPIDSDGIPEEVRLALQQEQIDKSEEWFPNVRVRVNGVEVHGKKKNASFIFLLIFIVVFIGLIVFILSLD